MPEATETTIAARYQERIKSSSNAQEAGFSLRFPPRSRPFAIRDSLCHAAITFFSGQSTRN
jgi:hypothetical protein